MTVKLTVLDDYEIRHVITHLVRAGRVDEADAGLRHLPLLADLVTRAGVDALLEDFDEVVQAAEYGPGVLRNGLSHAGHVLRADPAQLPGQLLARLTPAEIGDRLAGQLDRFAAWPWLRPMQPAHLVAPAALLRTIDARARFIDATAISEDGSLIVSGDRDGIVAVWEASTGRELDRLPQFDSSVEGLAAINGRTIIVATGGGSVVRMDWRARVVEARADMGTGISAFAITAAAVFAGRSDGHVAALAPADLRTLWEQDTSEGVPYALAAAVGGVVAATRDGAVVLLPGPPARPRVLARLPTRLHAVAVAWDGSVLVGGKDNFLYVVPPDGEVRKLKGHRNQVRAIAAAGRSTALSTSYDGSVLRWDLATGAAALVGTHAGWGLALAAAGEVAVSGSEDGTLRLWRPALADGPPPHVARAVKDVAVSSDGRLAAAAGPGRRLRIVALPDGTELLSRNLPGRGVTAVAVAGPYVIACGNDGSVWRAPIAGGEPTRIGRHERGLDCLRVTRDGRLAVTAGRDSTVRIWNVESAAPVAKITSDAWFEALAVTPDGARIAAGDWSYKIHLYGRRRARPLRTFAGHEQTISCLSFARGGRALVSGSWDGTVRLWQGSSDDARWVVAHDDWVSALSITPDGHHIVAGYSGGAVRVLRLGDGREVHRLAGHSGYVTAVEVTPDGTRAVTAGGDGTLRVWSLVDGREVCAFDEEPSLQCCALTGGDPMTIVGGDEAGNLRTYVLHGDPRISC